MGPGDNILIIQIILALVTLAIGIGIGYGVRQYLLMRDQKRMEGEADNIITHAREQAAEIELQAKDKILQLRQQADQENGRRRAEITREEDRLQKRREEVDLRVDRLEKREQNLNKRQSALDRRTIDVDKLHAKQMEELQRISMMTTDEARKILLDEVEKDARNDMARVIRQIEAEAKEDGERRARSLIATAIQRVASEHVAEITTSTVTIPADEMKG